MGTRSETVCEAEAEEVLQPNREGVSTASPVPAVTFSMSLRVNSCVLFSLIILESGDNAYFLTYLR